MDEHPRPDTPIVHHEATPNGHQPYEQADGPQSVAAPGAPATEQAAALLSPPRRFLLCHDDDLDADLPLIETIPASELDRIDPAGVYGCGLETGDHALLSLGRPGSDGREMARCSSAESALLLFSRVRPLRLVYLDPLEASEH